MERLFNPRVKKVIFFDLNQTLIDPKRTFRIHFIELLEEFSGRWADDDGTFKPEQIIKQYEKEWTRRKKKYTKVNQRKIQQSCLKKVLRPFPFDLNGPFVSQFFNELEKRKKEQPTLFRNALQTLNLLREKYQLGIITNSGLADMEKLGLAEFIPEEHVFTAKKCGVRKPNSAIFRHALKNMNLKPAEAIMVGNSWRNDIQGAMSCGMDAVWIRSTASRIRTVKKSGGKTAVQIQHIRQLTSLL